MLLLKLGQTQIVEQPHIYSCLLYTSYPKEILSLSAEMNDYVNYNIAANYFYDKENALTELEALRESAQ